MPTTTPTVVSPPAGTVLQGSLANTVTWLPGSFGGSIVGTNFLWIAESASGKVVWPALGPFETDGTSLVIPAGSIKTPGPYNVGVGFGTPGIANHNTPGAPFSGAAPGSTVWSGDIGIRAVVFF
jgi:hypothetical protein